MSTLDLQLQDVQVLRAQSGMLTHIKQVFPEAKLDHYPQEGDRALLDFTMNVEKNEDGLLAMMSVEYGGRQASIFVDAVALFATDDRTQLEQLNTEDLPQAIQDHILSAAYPHVREVIARLNELLRNPIIPPPYSTRDLEQ